MTVPQSQHRSVGQLPELDAVILAYGPEPWLADCIAAILASQDVAVRVHLVDNGSAQAETVAACDPRVRLISPRRNTGFAGGCVLGAAEGSAPIIVLVNSDAVVEPMALRHLTEQLDDDSVGLVTGCVLLGRDDPGRPSADVDDDIVNAAGNPVHWLGFSWAGGYLDPVGRHLEPRDVASVSGALCAIPRSLWQSLDGFDPTYFAYHEDVELSWRVWCAGRRVVYVPQARCLHHYDFGRHPDKFGLLERNRLLTVLTVYQASTLWRIAPALLATEAAMLVLATARGWGPAKLRGVLWVLRHAGFVRRRRRQVQSLRSVPDADWVWRLDNRLDLPREAQGGVPTLARRALAAYWRAVMPRRRPAG